MRHATPGLALAALALLAVASSACAEVYTPRPSGAVVVSGNGFGGYRVYKNGEAYGSEWSIREAVTGDPRAEHEADKAVSERVASVATGLIGAVGVGIGAGLLVDDLSNHGGSVNNTTGAASLGLVLGGLALAITGGFLQGASHTHTFNAANMYNDDMAARGTGVPPIFLPLPESGAPATLPPASVVLPPPPGYAAPPVDAPAISR